MYRRWVIASLLAGQLAGFLMTLAGAWRDDVLLLAGGAGISLAGAVVSDVLARPAPKPPLIDLRRVGRDA